MKLATREVLEPARTPQPAPTDSWHPGLILALAIVVAAAMVVVAAIALWPDEETPVPSEIAETWTTYTAADGVVSDCLCGMAISNDGMVWVVGFDGIARFDGRSWERLEPPRPFGDSPAVAAAPDGSVWISGADYVAQFSAGAWGPVIEAGFGVDEGDPRSFAGLAVDESGQVWTNLGDQDGIIVDGEFRPVADVAEPLESLEAEWVDAGGSTWTAIGDSIIGVEGALIQESGDRLVAHDLGGVRDVVFEADGTRWFLVPQVGPDAWMYGREQWSDPGLYRLDGAGWTRITTEDGLPDYRLSAIELGMDGSLWIAEVDGTIVRYQPGTDPVSGSPVEIGSRPFAQAELPQAPPPTEAP